VDAYGDDLDPPVKLSELLTRLHDLPGLERIRFLTSHPNHMSADLIDAVADLPKVCEHINLPVQAGDDLVLKRMARRYKAAEYRDLIGRIKERIPGVSLSTDVIVGFCGETVDQFERTLELLRTVRYDQVFAAAFSPRPGTPAARLPDDVPAAEKRRRLNELLAVQEAIGLERNQAWVGRTTEVLVEQIRPPRSHDHPETGTEPAGPQRPLADDHVRLSGRNREHRLVHLDGASTLLGGRVQVRVDRAGPYALVGSLAV